MGSRRVNLSKALRVAPAHKKNHFTIVIVMKEVLAANVGTCL